MIAGRLTERIELLRPIEDVNDFGDENTRYESAGVIHAERVKFTGSYRLEVAEHFPDYRAEFNIRSAHIVRENWHVKYDGVEYVVTNIEPNHQRGMKTLTCEKLNP